MHALGVEIVPGHEVPERRVRLREDLLVHLVGLRLGERLPPSLINVAPGVVGIVVLVIPDLKGVKRENSVSATR